jgi:hypothetical protein
MLSLLMLFGLLGLLICRSIGPRPLCHTAAPPVPAQISHSVVGA